MEIKEEIVMMDLLDWCCRQFNRTENGGKAMILLGMIVLLLGAYLFYALVHPEKF